MRMKTMNKIKRYILTFLTLLATTATWGGDIIIPTSYNHGTITASLENTTGVVTTANEGEAVLLNVSPNPGYILSSDNLRIVIYAKADNADTRTQIDTKDIVSFTTVDVNTYRFIMPKYDVEIEATFTDATDVESAVVTLKEGTIPCLRLGRSYTRNKFGSARWCHVGKEYGLRGFDYQHSGSS